MKRVFKPFDIVKLTKGYIEEKRSMPRMRFPGEFSLGRMSDSGKDNSRNLINYESLVGIVTETEGYEASVSWFNGSGISVKNAWFSQEELEVIGNAMITICDSMAHPSGGNTDQGEYFFGNKKRKKNVEQE